MTRGRVVLLSITCDGQMSKSSFSLLWAYRHIKACDSEPGGGRYNPRLHMRDPWIWRSHHALTEPFLSPNDFMLQITTRTLRPACFSAAILCPGSRSTLDESIQLRRPKHITGFQPVRYRLIGVISSFQPSTAALFNSRRRLEIPFGINTTTQLSCGQPITEESFRPSVCSVGVLAMRDNYEFLGGKISSDILLMLSERPL